MIREKRSREKLQIYYERFICDGVVDPNVHPWVAESWQASRRANIGNDNFTSLRCLDKEALVQRQLRHRVAIDYLNDMYRAIEEYFNLYELSLLLLDGEGYVIKNYAIPFTAVAVSNIEGVDLSEQNVGTTGVGMAFRYRVPFYVFGPEIWRNEWHGHDACTGPIVVDDKVEYVLALVATKPELLPHSAVAAVLLSFRQALEVYLRQHSQLEKRHLILDALPHTVYYILPNGEVEYTNKQGAQRLSVIAAARADGAYPNLHEAVLNYRHTPLHKGFLGVPSHNKEVTWITQCRTYEDLTTVIPVTGSAGVDGIVAISQPIHDIRTIVAHAVGYTARYSMASMAGNNVEFTALKDRAVRLAKTNRHILLQGEAGTGKQRLAHAIHQSSLRAAGPLILLRCGDIQTEFLEEELFGGNVNGESRTGKLELANEGTLFVDDIDKIPLAIQAKLAAVLFSGVLTRAGEAVQRPIDTRIIAASDSDVRRLAERGIFNDALYSVFNRTFLKMPALRARKDDISDLTEHIIAELAEQNGMPIKKLTADAIDLLVNYDWPGNIKQLQGVLEQTFFNTTSDKIDVDDVVMPGERIAQREWKNDREAFVRAWQATGGNISRLANKLNVSRVTLYRYIKKYGLERE